MKKDIKDHFRNNLKWHIELNASHKQRKKLERLLKNFDKNIDNRKFNRFLERIMNSSKNKVYNLFAYFERK